MDEAALVEDGVYVWVDVVLVVVEADVDDSVGMALVVDNDDKAVGVERYGVVEEIDDELDTVGLVEKDVGIVVVVEAVVVVAVDDDSVEVALVLDTDE